MNRASRLLLFTLAAIVTVATVSSSGVLAQTASPQGQLKPGDSSLYNSVQMDCLPVKFKLSRTHENDALLRVNLGQSYESVSNKLMARLNGRIVQSRLDGADLVKKAADFETALTKFKADYQKYEVAMNGLIKSDCQSQVQTYYATIESTRELRDTVDNDVKLLNQRMKEYYDAFAKFRKTVETKEKEARDAADN